MNTVYSKYRFVESHAQIILIKKDPKMEVFTKNHLFGETDFVNGILPYDSAVNDRNKG